MIPKAIFQNLVKQRMIKENKYQFSNGRKSFEAIDPREEEKGTLGPIINWTVMPIITI